MRKNKSGKKFYFVKSKQDEGVSVEYDKTQHCEFCDSEGSYWIGGNNSICKPCILGIANLFKNHHQE